MYHYKTKPTSITELPPTSTSIRYHILRAFYQTYIQTQVLNDTCEIISPLKFGFKQVDNHLSPVVVENLYPSEKELIRNCTCNKCSTKTCRCKAAGVPCCSFCKCSNNNENICQNNNNAINAK